MQDQSGQAEENVEYRLNEQAVAEGFFHRFIAIRASQLAQHGEIKVTVWHLEPKLRDAFVAYLEKVKQPIEIFDGLNKFWIVVEKFGNGRYCVKPSLAPKEYARSTGAFVSPTQLARTLAAP